LYFVFCVLCFVGVCASYSFEVSSRNVTDFVHFSLSPFTPLSTLMPVIMVDTVNWKVIGIGDWFEW